MTDVPEVPPEMNLVRICNPWGEYFRLEFGIHYETCDVEKFDAKELEEMVRKIRERAEEWGKSHATS